MNLAPEKQPDAYMKQHFFSGWMMKAEDKIAFQRLFWGALAGCLAAALVCQSPFLESLELTMLKWRYQVCRLFTSVKAAPCLSRDVSLVVFDDSAQFDLGIARFNDERSQDILASALAVIEKGQPAVVVIDLDLRGAAQSNLVKLFRGHRNVVIALFGSLEGATDLPASEFMTHAASYGYRELMRESNGVVYRLPVNSEGKFEEESGLAPVPTLTEAVIDVYRRVKGVGPASQFMSQLPDQPVYINFTDIAYPTWSLLDVLSPGFNSDVFKGRVVMIGSVFTARHNDPLRCRTPLSDSMPELTVQAQAVSTLLDNKVIFSFAGQLSRHFLLLLGAVFGAACSALPGRSRTILFLAGIVGLLATAQLSFQVYHVAFPAVPSLAVIFACFVLGTVIYLDTDLRQRNRQLAQARESMQVRAEEERRRIAEDLHDETLPALSSVARMADRLCQDMSGNPVPKEMRQRLDAAVGEMRRVINDLHPSVLETMGFVPALENLLNICSQESSIESRFVDATNHFDTEAISRFARLQLYRIVQEALNNVLKHAQASRVQLSIQSNDGSLLISVTDDGTGIDTRSVKWDSHGLTNIRQRAQLIGARVSWVKPEQFASGTKLIVEIKDTEAQRKE